MVTIEIVEALDVGAVVTVVAGMDAAQAANFILQMSAVPGVTVTRKAYTATSDVDNLTRLAAPTNTATT